MVDCSAALGVCTHPRTDWHRRQQHVALATLLFSLSDQFVRSNHFARIFLVFFCSRSRICRCSPSSVASVAAHPPLVAPHGYRIPHTSLCATGSLPMAVAEARTGQRASAARTETRPHRCGCRRRPKSRLTNTFHGPKPPSPFVRSPNHLGLRLASGSW